MTGGRNLTSLMLVLASWIVMRVGMAGRSAADEPVAALRTVERLAPARPLTMTSQPKIVDSHQPLNPSIRHCERSEAFQLQRGLDCFAALAMMKKGGPVSQIPSVARLEKLVTMRLPSTMIEPIGLGQTSELFASRSPTPTIADPMSERLVPAPAATKEPSFKVTGSYWSVVRSGSGTASLAGGSELGGSQAGFRLTAPLPLSALGGAIGLSGRGYAPLATNRGKEAAIGLVWSGPVRLPVELIVERRVGLDRGGRDAVAALVAGGFGPVPVAKGWTAQGYVQAGMVGLRRRDGFADGQLSLAKDVSLPLIGKGQIGGGIWGGVQPGVHRVDAGPQFRLPLPVGPGGSQLSTEWRFRLAGNARPSSGPSLTLSGSF